MELDATILATLQQYQLIAVFVGAYIFSEVVLIPSAFLAQQGVFAAFPLFMVALIATLLSDAMWYKFGKLFLKVTHRLGRYQEKVHRTTAVVKKLTGKRTHVFLIFFKFIYGFRLLTILSLSMRHYPFWTFMAFNAVGTSIWLLVILAIGWLLGVGIDLLPAVNVVEYAIFAAVILVVAFKIFTAWLGRRVEAEENI